MKRDNFLHLLVFCIASISVCCCSCCYYYCFFFSFYLREVEIEKKKIMFLFCFSDGLVSQCSSCFTSSSSKSSYFISNCFCSLRTVNVCMCVRACVHERVYARFCLFATSTCIFLFAVESHVNSKSLHTQK